MSRDGEYPASRGFLLAWLSAFIFYATVKPRKRLRKYQKTCQKETSARRINGELLAAEFASKKKSMSKNNCHYLRIPLVYQETKDNMFS